MFPLYLILKNLRVNEAWKKGCLPAHFSAEQTLISHFFHRVKTGGNFNLAQLIGIEPGAQLIDKR